MAINKSKIESWFPNIIGQTFKISQSVGDFNCVSFTLDIFDGWMWTNTELWPYQQISRNSGLSGFKKLYTLYGYKECNNSIFEDGYVKIAFYAKQNIPMHACKQFGKIWKSKIGENTIIDHELEWLCGNTEDAYGDIAFIMKKLL
jgi:hypothetical protein